MSKSEGAGIGNMYGEEGGREGGIVAMDRVNERALDVYERILCIRVFIIWSIWLSWSPTVWAHICGVSFHHDRFHWCIKGMGDAVAKEISKDRKDRNGLENGAGRHQTGMWCQGRNVLLHASAVLGYVRMRNKQNGKCKIREYLPAFGNVKNPFRLHATRTALSTSDAIARSDIWTSAIFIWNEREVCVM